MILPPHYSWRKGKSEVLICPHSQSHSVAGSEIEIYILPPDHIPALWSILNLFVYFHVQNGTQVTKEAPALIWVIRALQLAWTGSASRRAASN